MALVSISEAAKLVRKNRTTIYRDIEKGRLSKTVSGQGETRIETSELMRTYGQIYLDGEPEPKQAGAADASVKIALLEERNRSLERALALEAELRRIKDQVASELRARIADKENVIKVLESKVLFLEYDRQVQPAGNKESQETAAEKAPPKRSWWERFLLKRHGPV